MGVVSENAAKNAFISCFFPRETPKFEFKNLQKNQDRFQHVWNPDPSELLKIRKFVGNETPYFLSHRNISRRAKLYVTLTKSIISVTASYLTVKIHQEFKFRKVICCMEKKKLIEKS